MERERMRGGGYRVFLSDEDLKQWGVDFASLDSRSPATRALLSAVSLVVRGGEWDGEGMEVEALPVEGGCFLLLTPIRPPVLKPKVRRPAAPLVYRIPDADAWLGLLAAVSSSGERSRFAAGSLYAWTDGYRLVLYPFEPLSAVMQARLSEWGEPVASGAAAAAVVAEHGKPLVIGNALERLHEGD
ncbi:MAG: hypothetical protein IKI63_01030 [Clostridia bacterium]|nr:hypothetical protein [Clostridia bacterium]